MAQLSGLRARVDFGRRAFEVLDELVGGAAAVTSPSVEIPKEQTPIILSQKVMPISVSRVNPSEPIR